MFVNTKHRYSVIVRVSVVFRKTCWTLTLPINRRKYINEYYNYQGWIVTWFIIFFLAFLWRLVGVFTGVPGMHEINIMLAFTHAHNTHTLTPHARTRTLIFSEIFPTEDRESSNWWQSFWTCFGCPPVSGFFAPRELLRELMRRDIGRSKSLLDFYFNILAVRLLRARFLVQNEPKRPARRPNSH